MGPEKARPAATKAHEGAVIAEGEVGARRSVARGAAAAPSIALSGLGDSNVVGLRTLLALTHFELDYITLVQVAITLPRDGTEVDEQIGATVILLDEAKPLLPVEPLDFTCRHPLSNPPAQKRVLRFPGLRPVSENGLSPNIGSPRF